LNPHKVAIGFGNFYAPRLLEALGTDDSVLRVSFAHYNTMDEVERLIDALDKAL